MEDLQNMITEKQEQLRAAIKDGNTPLAQQLGNEIDHLQVRFSALKNASHEVTQ